MLVYIKSKESGSVASISLKEIQYISSVEKVSNGFCYRIATAHGEYFSKVFSSKEEAEMSHLSTTSMLNAIELMYERAKHVPEDRLTPVYFQVVDPVQNKLVAGKLSLYDVPVYTIEI